MQHQITPHNWPGRWFGLVLLFLGVLSSGGCLDFERQTALFVFVPDKDEVQALLIYEGLRVGGTEDKKNEKKAQDNLKKASDELTALIKGDRFYVGSSLLSYDLTVNEKTSKEKRQAIEFLKKHLTIRKGFIVTGKNGRFTYCQPISVREPGKLVAGVNDMISAVVAGTTEQPKDSVWDADTFRMVQKAARDKHAWLKLEPGRLSYTMPATPGFVTRVKRELVVDPIAALRKQIDVLPDKTEEMRAAVARLKGELENIERSAAALAELPLSVDVRANQVTVALGFGNGEALRLQSPDSPRTVPPGKREADLLAHARTLGVPFRREIDVDAILAEFQREHGTKK